MNGIKMKILIIEDEYLMRNLLEQTLLPFSEEIRNSSTLGHALEILNLMPRVDLVVLDLKLSDSPVASTANSVQEIKRLHPETAVMVISGMLDFEPELEDLCRKNGADVVVRKNPVECKRQALLTACLKAVNMRKLYSLDSPEFMHRIKLLEAAIL